MSLRSRLIGAVCATSLVALGIAWSGSTAFAANSADIPTSSSLGAPGSVLSASPMTLNSTLSAVATGQRITYVSTNPSGSKIAVSAALLRPKINSGPGKGKTVAWGHGTAGSADKCAPSKFSNLYPSASYLEYANLTASILSKSYTLVATDFAGLGTAGPHPYLVGNSEARATIDSVRAARKLIPSLTNKWLTVGHSQGGQSSLFAGEIAGSYAGGLNLLGVVGIAPASSLDQLALTIAGTPGQGYLVMALYGLAAVDPTVHPEQLLAQPALAKANIVLNTGCYDEIFAAYADLTAEQLLVGGTLPDAIIAKFATSNPAQQPIQVPLLLVQGTADETIPVEATQYLAYQECLAGTTTELREYANATHDSVLPAAQNDIIAFLNARIAGQPATSTC